MENTIERKVDGSFRLGTESSYQAKEKDSYTSFAEQYLETPVFEGASEGSALAKFTATACTFRGIPIWDDF